MEIYIAYGDVVMVTVDAVNTNAVIKKDSVAKSYVVMETVDVVNGDEIITKDSVA